MKKRNLLSKLLLTLVLLVTIGILSMNAQVLKHQYTFDGNANDAIGGVNGTPSGGVFDNGGYVLFDGTEYIEFDAAALALNEYESITVESYVERGTNADDEYNVVWYFGGYRGTNDYALSIVRGNSICQTEINGKTASGPEPANGDTHHYVSILTKTSVKLYIDGILNSETSLSEDYISSLGLADGHDAAAFIGKSTWPDKSFKGTIYEWNIYEGELDETTIYNHAKDFVTVDDSKLSSLTVTEGALYPSFVPATTEYVVVLNPGTNSIDISALPFDEAAIVLGSENSSPIDLNNIAITEESGDINISVIGAGVDQTDYKIHYIVNTDLTLKHSYDFNTEFDISDGTGSVDGFTGWLNVFGGAWHADGNQDSKITFDGEALALNTYPSITFEGHVTLGENGGYTILYYFGTDGNSNSTLLRLTDGSDANESWAQIGGNNVTYAAYPEQDPFTEHHYVIVLTYGYIKYYLDGALVAETQITNSGSYISSIGTEVAILGMGTWNDPLLNADVDEFNIYSGEMDAATVADRCTAYGITPTGVKKTAAKISKVYPTISSDVFNVEFTDQAGTITVYDLSGNVVKQIQPEGLTTTFTVNAPGIYIVQVTSGNVVNTYKVVKK